MGWIDDANFNNTLISSSAIAGITIGSLAAGSICEMGRRKSMLGANLVCIVSTLVMLVEDLYVIMTGRFIQAFASGVILCASNLYLAETIPAHKRAIYANALNLGVVTGLLITTLMGLELPLPGTPEAVTT